MLYSHLVCMIELAKVERENKVYINGNTIIVDKNAVTASELLELAGFSPFVYDIYLIQNELKRSKKSANKPLKENKEVKIKTGMQFNAILKEP